MKKITRFVVSIIVSMFFGGLFGFLWANRTMRSGANLMSEVYALGEFETLTSLQYQQADESKGKAALLDTT